MRPERAPQAVVCQRQLPQRLVPVLGRPVVAGVFGAGCLCSAGDGLEDRLAIGLVCEDEGVDEGGEGEEGGEEEEDC